MHAHNGFSTKIQRQHLKKSFFNFIKSLLFYTYTSPGSDFCKRTSYIHHTFFVFWVCFFFYYYMAFNENATFWELTLTVCIIRENESSIIIHTPSNCKPKSFQKTWMCQELWQLWLEPENCSTAEFLMNFSSYFL